MRAIGKVKNSNRFLIARKGMMICKKIIACTFLVHASR